MMYLIGRFRLILRFDIRTDKFFGIVIKIAHLYGFQGSWDVIPRMLAKIIDGRVYFISDSNEKISNENIVIADKKDKDTTKRMFRLHFNFKNKKYDKSQKYYLVAYDDKNDIEVLRHEIIMDIAFADDFGFFG